MPYRDFYLTELVSHERSGVDVNRKFCQQCRCFVFIEASRAYRCEECFEIPILCCDCIILHHWSTPYHRIKVRILCRYRTYRLTFHIGMGEQILEGNYTI